MKEVQKTVYQSDDGAEFPLNPAGKMAALGRDRVVSYNAALRSLKYESARNVVSILYEVIVDTKLFRVADIDRTIALLQRQREITPLSGDE